MTETDILVIGAGPAGLAAAIEGARAGARVIVLDENDRSGGQLYKQIHKFFGSQKHFAGLRGFQIGETLVQESRESGVELWLNTRALGLLDRGELWVLRDNRTEVICAKKYILAAGARENALAFPGWTLPGVMTAGAAQTFSNVHGTLVGEKILTVGSGNVGLIVSYQMMQAGADIIGLIEAQSNITGYGVHAGKIKRAGVPVWTQHTIVQAKGSQCVEEAIIAQVDEYWRPVPGTEISLVVDTVLLAVGLSPKVELPRMFGCRLTLEKALGGYLPAHDANMRTSHPDVYVCGDIAGVEEANTALDEGRLAGVSAAGELGFSGNTDIHERVNDLQESLCQLRMGVFGAGRQACKERIVRGKDR